MSLTLTPLSNLPKFQENSDLPFAVCKSLAEGGIDLEDQDIFVIAQKVVSKVEGRFVNLATVSPTSRALSYASIVKKDPRLVELILQESRSVVRIRPGVMIVEHRLGFICANAGIDHSNVKGPKDGEEIVLLLPENPDLSAKQIREKLEFSTGKKLGVLIIDSHGRAWRNGTVGVSIGLSGLPGLVDLRGIKDLFGYILKVTQVGAADELAAAASLVMGQADEGTPVVHVRGFPYTLKDSGLSELIRDQDQDMFR